MALKRYLDKDDSVLRELRLQFLGNCKKRQGCGKSMSITYIDSNCMHVEPGRIFDPDVQIIDQ